MNNQKPILIAGSIALGVIALSLVFMAGRMSGGEGRFDRGFDGRGQMMGGNFDQKGLKGKINGKKGPMMNREMQFIDEKSLSAEQKTQLEAIRKDQQEKTQELMQSFRTGSGISETEMTTQIETIWKEHMVSLRQFVSADNLADFDAFVIEGKPQMGIVGNRKELNRNNR